MEYAKDVLEFIAVSADLVGLTILLIGALKFLGSYIAFEFKKLLGRDCAIQIRNLRLPLGSYILLSLEFMIISDIINSALSRTVNDFLLLALIVAIRTVIGFFLGQDLKETRDQQ